MAEIRFRKNNTEYHLDFRGINAPCEQQLAFRYNGDTYYVPAMSTQGTKVLGGTYNGESWYYDTSSPTIAFRKNGKTYFCSKSLTTEQQLISYDIPAGTYSPSTFKSLIENYISPNGSRIVLNSFKAKVNGQTITINANTAIYNVNNSSSGVSSVSYAVNFSGNYMTERSAFSINTAVSFTEHKVYITQSRGIQYFNNYRNFNITISTGIKFK